MRPCSRGKWRHGESNSRHSACKADALPTELCPLKTPVYLAASLPWDSEKARRSWLFQVGPDGLEPSTFALSERRSNQLSYEPWHTLADQGWRIVGEHPRPGKGEIRFSPQERSRVRATVARWSPSQSSNPTRPLLRRPASGDRPPRALRNGAPAPPGSARADGQDLASPDTNCLGQKSPI